MPQYDLYNMSLIGGNFAVSGGNYAMMHTIQNAEGGTVLEINEPVKLLFNGLELFNGFSFHGWSSDGIVVYDGAQYLFFSPSSALPDGHPTPLTFTAYDVDSPPPCFLTGTLIETIEGKVAVEELVEGSMVKLLSGGYAPLKWIGRRTVSDRMILQAREKSLPIRFAAGSLGNGLPERDLWVSPDHCLYHDGALIQAKTLVNGTTVAQLHCGGKITYFHLLLDRHEVIFAEGAASETYRPCNNMFGFHNAESFPADVERNQPRKTGCFPVQAKGPAFEALKALIAAEAEALDASVTAAA